MDTTPNMTLGEPWTVEQFLEWEDRQEGRHEFDGVNVVEMTGGTRNHQLITFNVTRFLMDLLDPERFEVMLEMRVQMGRQARYPDVAVTAAPVGGKVRTLRDALVLFEVLSDDTEKTDRGIKPANYAQLPGLRRYVLLEQDRMAATVLERTADGWMETPVMDKVSLPELGAVLPFAAIYRNVRF